MLRPDPGGKTGKTIVVALVLLCLSVPAAMAATDGLPSSEFEVLQPLPLSQCGLIYHGNRSENKVALTFDLCQSRGSPSGFDSKVADVLSRTKTPATFFLGGLWMRDHRAETHVLAGNPLFELGNHSWSHPDFSRMTPGKISEEIQKTQRMMWEILGYQTKLFRFPYGTYTEDALRVIGQNGLHAIQWDVVSGDPDPGITADRMAQWVLAQVKPGSIVIMHANGRGRHTAGALPAIIHSLQGKGYTFVTISDLLGLGGP